MVFGVTLLAFGTLRNYEDKTAENDFQVSAQGKVDRLSSSLRVALDKLRALGAYYDTNIEIDRHTFQLLTHAYQDGFSPIQALEWLPRVLDSDRARSIQVARNDGYPDFDFTESETQGATVRAGKRSVYYPAYFIEPLSGNEKAFGFDLASNPTRYAALEKAAKTGQLSATHRIALVQGSSDQYGFLVFRPVYQDGAVPADASQRIPRLRGLLLGVYKLGDIIDDLDKEAISKVDLTVFDDSAPIGERRLYPKNSNDFTSDGPPAAFQLTRQIDMAGHTWSVIATPKAGAFPANRDVSTTTLLLGLLISALWAFNLRQKSVRQALIQSTFEQKEILENDLIGFAKVKNRVILWANPAFEKMLGYGSCELVGTPTRKYYASEEAYQAVGVADAPILEAGKVFRSQIEHVRRDGTHIWVDISGGMLDRATGEVLWCFVDATDRHNAEQLRADSEEIAAKNRQLQEASRLKSEFLAMMSHELRTPLNAIIGFSEVLQDGLLGELAPKQKDYVNEIFLSGRHLLSLINDILDLSKVEAGKMTLEIEPVIVADLIQAGLYVVREKAIAHRLRLTSEIAPDLDEIWLDQRKAKQILYNLLSNAVKFTPAGGDINVTVRRSERDDRKDQAFTSFLEIAVTDTGIGISAADQARLFQPFTQIDSTLGRQYEGTGLGLVMVKQLAELHGGGVAMQSTPGKGSTFTVWLPWRMAAEDVAPTAAPAHVM